MKAPRITTGLAIAAALSLVGCSTPTNAVQASNHTTTVSHAMEPSSKSFPMQGDVQSTTISSDTAAQTSRATQDAKASNWHPVPSYIDPQGHNLSVTSQMIGLTTVYVPTQIQGAGSLVKIGGGASSNTLSIAFKHLNINESAVPLTGGGIVTKKNTVTLANGVKAQWIAVTGHVSTIWALQFQMGSVYMSVASTDNIMGKSEVEQFASSMMPIQP